MSIRDQIVANKEFHLSENLFYQTGLSRQNDFESAYVKLREREGRIYSDETVSKLPSIDRQHPLYREWRVRERSLERLVRYMLKDKFKNALEVGCGNGWLSNQIHVKTNADVMGVDVNETELLQASRVFTSNKITFAYLDILTSIATPQFDIIILASCIQYFPNLFLLVERLMPRLNSGGEIHIIDSPFYSENNVANAKARSETYFNQFGISSTNPFYFHHSWKQLDEFKYDILYSPTSLIHSITKIVSPDSPFPWIRITR